MKKFLIGASFFLAFYVMDPVKSCAQTGLFAQVRTRSEFRQGYGSPLAVSASPAFFTSQRTRLGLRYSGYRIKLGLTAQDVRVWGQDVSTINRTTTQDNNGLMLHEAWAEFAFTDTMVKNKYVALRLGRQELVYDDQRLLGNLDWLQQGRRHDALLFRFEKNKWMLHSGFAFNQNREANSGTQYNSTPPANYPANTNGGSAYKSLAFLYGSSKLAKGNVSFLFLADQFNKYRTDTINNLPAKTWVDGVSNRMTTGFYFINAFGKLQVSASAYYQFGKNASQQKLDGALLSLSTNYQVGRKFSTGPGIDYTTGGSPGQKSRAFDPLYGTPHKFWGLMDYFYAASGFGNKGLSDIYLKTKYKPSPSFLFTLDLHDFRSASTVYSATGTSMKRRFGNEVDFTAGYSFTKDIFFEAGYGHFLGTSTLVAPAVKNVTNAEKNSNWAYVMVNIKPEMIFK